MLIAGATIVLLLAVGIGSAAYGILFPPVWTERLPFTNSTGQYDSITVYRNATDDTYGNVTKLIADVAESLEKDVAADPRYRCVEYAVLLHDEAQRHGINCTVAGTGTGRETPGHALVAFRTTDSGMAFADLTAKNVSASDYPGIDFSKVILLRDSWNETLPCRNAMGTSPAVSERRDAQPVSYARLEAFLSGDHVEDSPYVFPGYTCLDFATLLHDRAETAGIKCGIVTVAFEGKEDGHAFNAFPTTDRGVIYIDCTGINKSDLDDGALPTDNIVYLAIGRELGELPVTQVNGNLDYEFYLDRKERIDAYRAQWKLYVVDVTAYNAEVDDHDVRLMDNEQIYNAYRSDCDRYMAALKEYNRQMGEHNDAVMAHNAGNTNVAIPPAPSNRAELEAWKASLDGQYNQYLSTWNNLEAWRHRLNDQKALLDGRLKDLRNAEESKWITFSPMGIVRNIEIYWG